MREEKKQKVKTIRIGGADIVIGSTSISATTSGLTSKEQFETLRKAADSAIYKTEDLASPDYDEATA